MTANRRTFLAGAAASLALPRLAAAQERRFEPRPGPWRTFELTTRVELPVTQGASQLWVPLPSVDTDWQRSLESSYASNGRIARVADNREGARMVHVVFDAGVAQPYLEVTSRVQTRDRTVDWQQRSAVPEHPSTLAWCLRPTALIPVDGIVRETARKAIGSARTDVEKVRRIYDWVVTNTYREPKVRGCGEGDIRTMLETGDLGGKCADLNALFVGLCRSVGVPARDLYGLRVAPSAFGYRELGANSERLQSAQHCRAEVYLQGYGWVAMDPADVAKVMRQETSEWIRTVQHPLVTPVYRGLYGAWEGNWIAYNTAHDVELPGSRFGKLGFLMYPVAEDSKGRFDSYTPDTFKYQIRARELKA